MDSKGRIEAQGTRASLEIAWLGPECVHCFGVEHEGTKKYVDGGEGEKTKGH